MTSSDGMLRLKLASRFWQRLVGLLPYNDNWPFEGLWLVPCWSVHTFGLRRPIDLVFLDRKLAIVKVQHSVLPWRLALCWPCLLGNRIAGGLFAAQPQLQAGYSPGRWVFCLGITKIGRAHV